MMPSPLGGMTNPSQAEPDPLAQRDAPESSPRSAGADDRKRHPRKKKLVSPGEKLTSVVPRERDLPLRSPGFEEKHGTGLAFRGTSATNKEYRQMPCAIARSHPTRACHRRQSRTRRRPKDATQSTTGRMRKGAPSWIAKATRSYSPNRSQSKTPMPKMTLATNIITIAEVKTSAKRYRTIESGTVDRSFLRGEGRRSRRTSGRNDTTSPEASQKDMNGE